MIEVMVGISENHFSANLPILDGNNWEKWCIQMRVIINIQDVSKGLQLLA